MRGVRKMISNKHFLFIVCSFFFYFVVLAQDQQAQYKQWLDEYYISHFQTARDRSQLSKKVFDARIAAPLLRMSEQGHLQLSSEEQERNAHIRKLIATSLLRSFHEERTELGDYHLKLSKKYRQQDRALKQAAATITQGGAFFLVGLLLMLFVKTLLSGLIYASGSRYYNKNILR